MAGKIPDDIIEAARAVYDELRGIENDDGREPWKDEDIATIARAIFAERQRSAANSGKDTNE